MLTLITESLQGGHKPPFKALTVSTKGAKVIRLNEKGDYELLPSFLYFIKKRKKRRTVLLGTDFDHVGTKVATVIRNYLENEGINCVRTAFTENGYAKIGRFYTDKELRSFAEIERLNVKVAKFFRERFSNVPTTGLKKAIIVKELKKARENGITRIKVKQKGTATVTAFTKALLRGKSPSFIKKKLESLYLSGAIEYPRVEADYFSEPFQVYSHPPLTSNGYSDEYVSPFETDELPLNLNTSVLYLAMKRITTPSAVYSDYSFIKKIFEDDLKVKNGYEKYARECESIANEFESDYKVYLRDISPLASLKLIPVKNKKEEELEELFWRIRKAEEEREIKKQTNNKNFRDLEM